jgi:hypothetical protein
LPLPTNLSSKELERIALNLNPGGWAIEASRPLATLLGSCVSVCLFDPKLMIGGMNHFLLPRGSNVNSNDQDVILNGDYSMEVLVNGLLNKGAQKKPPDCEGFWRRHHRQFDPGWRSASAMPSSRRNGCGARGFR